MKSLFSILAVLLCSGILCAQKQKETRDLSGFDAISISGGFEKITLVEGDKESVEIEASGVNLDKIITKVSGKALILEMKKGNYHHSKITMVVHYRAIKEINNSGSTDIETANAISGDKFDFNSSGSGDFKGEFNVNTLNVAISGSSDMDLQGKAEKQDYAISGSGDVDASGLSGNSASVAISGSGDVQLNVSGRVKTAVSGSGKVQNNH